MDNFDAIFYREDRLLLQQPPHDAKICNFRIPVKNFYQKMKQYPQKMDTCRLKSHNSLFDLLIQLGLTVDNVVDTAYQMSSTIACYRPLCHGGD